MRFVVIDTESIGAHRSARLYEIGIVTIDRNGDVLDQYETLIRSPKSDLHKRVARHLNGAPSFLEVTGDVLARMQTGVVAGHMTEHNLVMIQSELNRLGFGLPQVPYLCTNDLATVLHFDSSSRRLAALAHTPGVEMESWHTARGDAAVTAQVLIGLLNVAAERGVLENLSRPSTFNGSWPTWPSFAISDHYLVRDPIAFPPIGDQPDDVTCCRVSPASRHAPL